MQSRFEAKKHKILEQLDVPDGDYHDLSPKGSIDGPIRTLIADINSLQGQVTTSSCSGRVSVFLEGRKKDSNVLDNEGVAEPSIAGPGGKGGGSWLYMSHSPVEVPQDGSNPCFMDVFGLQGPDVQLKGARYANRRYIHIKFEPMILHILTASLAEAQGVLTAALSAGFRESGAVSLNASKVGEINPLVAVRSTGYSFDAIIGYQNETGNNIALIDEEYLQTLVGIANERFKVNTERIERFRSALLEQFAQKTFATKASVRSEWEDPEARRQRKREEGLRRREQLQAQSMLVSETDTAASTEDAGFNGVFA